METIVTRMNFTHSFFPPCKSLYESEHKSSSKHYNIGSDSNDSGQEWLKNIDTWKYWWIYAIYSPDELSKDCFRYSPDWLFIHVGKISFELTVWGYNERKINMLRSRFTRGIIFIPFLGIIKAIGRVVTYQDIWGGGGQWIFPSGWSLPTNITN